MTNYTHNDMEERIKALIARVLNVDIVEVDSDTEIGDLDEWDSLHNVAIFKEIESEFGIKITAEMMIDLEDVSDIVSLVEELTEEA